MGPQLPPAGRPPSPPLRPPQSSVRHWRPATGHLSCAAAVQPSQRRAFAAVATSSGNASLACLQWEPSADADADADDGPMVETVSAPLPSPAVGLAALDRAALAGVDAPRGACLVACARGDIAVVCAATGAVLARDRLPDRRRVLLAAARPGEGTLALVVASADGDGASTSASAPATSVVVVSSLAGRVVRVLEGPLAPPPHAVSNPTPVAVAAPSPGGLAVLWSCGHLSTWTDSAARAALAAPRRLGRPAVDTLLGPAVALPAPAGVGAPAPDRSDGKRRRGAQAVAFESAVRPRSAVLDALPSGHVAVGVVVAPGAGAAAGPLRGRRAGSPAVVVLCPRHGHVAAAAPVDDAADAGGPAAGGPVAAVSAERAGRGADDRWTLRWVVGGAVDVDASDAASAVSASGSTLARLPPPSSAAALAARGRAAWGIVQDGTGVPVVAVPAPSSGRVRADAADARAAAADEKDDVDDEDDDRVVDLPALAALRVAASAVSARLAAVDAAAAVSDADASAAVAALADALAAAGSARGPPSPEVAASLAASLGPRHRWGALDVVLTRPELGAETRRRPGRLPGLLDRGCVASRALAAGRPGLTARLLAAGGRCPPAELGRCLRGALMAPRGDGGRADADTAADAMPSRGRGSGRRGSKEEAKETTPRAATSCGTALVRRARADAAALMTAAEAATASGHAGTGTGAAAWAAANAGAAAAVGAALCVSSLDDAAAARAGPLPPAPHRLVLATLLDQGHRGAVLSDAVAAVATSSVAADADPASSPLVRFVSWLAWWLRAYADHPLLAECGGGRGPAQPWLRPPSLSSVAAWAGAVAGAAGGQGLVGFAGRGGGAAKDGPGRMAVRSLVAAADAAVAAAAGGGGGGGGEGTVDDASASGGGGASWRRGRRGRRREAARAGELLSLAGAAGHLAAGKPLPRSRGLGAAGAGGGLGTIYRMETVALPG